MYSPPHFKIENPDLIRSFLRANSFGILFSLDGEGGFHDTHVPMIITENLSVLSGHIARANPQWRSWEESPAVKAVFHGPHGYISPSCYVSDFNVPTWNYSAVSVSGRVRIVSDREQEQEIMRELVAFYEKDRPEPWMLDETDPRFVRLFDAVVFFEIEITGIEAEFKLNQNKSREDQESVINYLSQTGSTNDTALARLMRTNIKDSGEKS